MTNEDLDALGGAAFFREASAELVDELLARDLIPEDREDTVRERLEEGEPAAALRIGLSENTE
jgi:hypothetical protein